MKKDTKVIFSYAGVIIGLAEIMNGQGIKVNVFTGLGILLIITSLFNFFYVISNE